MRKNNAGLQVKNLWWVGLFAIAMAYLESAVVVYLRRIYGISDLILSVPPFDPQIDMARCITCHQTYFRNGGLN